VFPEAKTGTSRWVRDRPLALPLTRSLRARDSVAFIDALPRWR